AAPSPGAASVSEVVVREVDAGYAGGEVCQLSGVEADVESDHEDVGADAELGRAVLAAAEEESALGVQAERDGDLRAVARAGKADPGRFVAADEERNVLGRVQTERPARADSHLHAHD